MIKLVKFPMLFKGKKIQPKIFDIAVVFIFVFLGMSLFFILFRKQSEVKIVVKVNEESLAYQIGGTPAWFTQFLHVGMKDTDVFNKPTAQVIGIKTYTVAKDNEIVYLTISLKTSYSPSKQRHTFNGKDILIGSTIELSLDNLLIKGLIVDIGEPKTLSNSKKLFVMAQLINSDPVFPQTEGVAPFVAEAIKEGDEIKDSLGRPVIKIVKKTVEDAKVAIPTANGQIIFQRHPMRKDVFLTLELWANKIADKYYLFGDTDLPILVGAPLPLYFKNIKILPIITQIDSV